MAPRAGVGAVSGVGHHGGGSIVTVMPDRKRGRPSSSGGDVVTAIGHNSRAMRAADLLIGRSADHAVLSCAWRAGDAHSARAASRAGCLIRTGTNPNPKSQDPNPNCKFAHGRHLTPTESSTAPLRLVTGTTPWGRCSRHRERPSAIMARPLGRASNR